MYKERTVALMLKVENIRFGYVPSVDIFRDVTFTIEGGEYIAIGGRNGCGKTTITRLLVGLEKASEGRMYYNGTDITSMPPSKRGQFIGYVFQQPDRQMFRPTVATEVAFGPESLGRTKSEVKRIVDEVLERTGIAHLREAYPPTLRRGEKQRVAIASALAMQSKILILDEPTRGIDVGAKFEIYTLINKIGRRRQGRHRHLLRTRGNPRRLGPHLHPGVRPHHRRGQGRRRHPGKPHGTHDYPNPQGRTRNDRRNQPG